MRKVTAVPDYYFYMEKDSSMAMMFQKGATLRQAGFRATATRQIWAGCPVAIWELAAVREPRPNRKARGCDGKT